MELQELEGNTLGEKHRYYNKILQERSLAPSNAQDITRDGSDVNNLLNIDIACRKKDVEYILKVLKGDDMLYVSRALKGSTWLITDPKYADIINPDYLQSEMFPNMTIKAVNKFKKIIRHNINDEKRAENFYENEKNKVDASKWLPHCSVEFIEKHISEASFIKSRLLKRICQKSSSIFETLYNNSQCYERGVYLKMVTLFLKTDVDKYLDLLEKDTYNSVKFNTRATNVIMKHSPSRIIDKIEIYISKVHIPTFVKYLKGYDIKSLLFKQTKKGLDRSQQRQLFHYDTLKHFIMRLPKNEQFEFVKQLSEVKDAKFKESEANVSSDAVGDDAAQMYKICNEHNKKNYIWYRFAPFEHAFEEISKLIAQGGPTVDKYDMLSLLITCAENNQQHIQAILEYYLNKHNNEAIHAKFRFVILLLRQTNIAKYDNKSWDMFNKLLTSMKIYEKSSEPMLEQANMKEIVNALIFYNALNDKEIPEMIERVYKFDTLKSYRKILNQQQQNKLFEYLYERLLSKIPENVTNEKIFDETVDTVEAILKLFLDYDKSLLDYPGILSKIRELIKLRKVHSWKKGLTSLYNTNKAWRKHMFEESVSLNPSEEVCLNALKHEPQLLMRYSVEVDAIRTNKDVMLTRLLAKLRVYWPQSLAPQWTDAFLTRIHEESAQNAVIRNLCLMMQQTSLLETIEKYKPDKAKIDWKTSDDRVINIQRLLAKNIHLGRPQPPPEAILSYAKGDYLQFALPSLLSIFYNLNLPMNREYIPKLLDAPVSLQKHGIRFAFKKLNQEELKIISLNCWKNSKNVTIRGTIFKHTFTLLCNEKDDANINSIWELLEMFINNLTFTENKDIYELLCEVQKVPCNIRAKYLMKSYNFIQKLIPNLPESDRQNYKWKSISMVGHSRELMDTICPTFIKDIIQDFVNADISNSEGKYLSSINHSDGLIKVMSAYLLHATNENDQFKKYEEVFAPLMKSSFKKWDDWNGNDYTMRHRFQQILTRLSYDVTEYVENNKVIIPSKMYALIQEELENKLPLEENYLMLTKWKLTVTLAKLREQYSSAEREDDTFGKEFGNICFEYLKNDVVSHFPCIYVLFSKAVKEVISYLLSQPATIGFYEGMLIDKEFIQSFLASIEIGSDHRSDPNYYKIWLNIYSHPSVEVKMHYFSKIKSEPPTLKCIS